MNSPSRAVVTLVLTLPLAFRAAAVKRHPGPWRIGVLSSRAASASAEKELWGQLPLGLAELGYVEGKDVVIEWRFSAGDYSRLDALAAELVHAPVDVIVTDGTPPTVAAQKATKTIPIVFTTVGDAVEYGLVGSLAHPGRNTTGISMMLFELHAKQLEMLRAFLPRLSRVAFLQNPENAANRRTLQNFLAAAGRANLQVISVYARSAPEIGPAIERISKEKADAFVLGGDQFVLQQRALIADLAGRNRLPWSCPYVVCADAGALIAYGPNTADTYRHAATFVDRILNGAKPGDIPVEQPRKFDLVINRKTAKALGLTIPPEILVQADRVIE